MPKIEPGFTWGNVTSIITTVVGVITVLGGAFAWSGAIGQRIDNFDRELLRIQQTVAEHESRLRTVEMVSGRQDERSMIIIDKLDKIEARLEAQGQ